MWFTKKPFEHLPTEPLLRKTRQIYSREESSNYDVTPLLILDFIFAVLRFCIVVGCVFAKGELLRNQVPFPLNLLYDSARCRSFDRP
jgi:hypothetical protein